MTLTGSGRAPGFVVTHAGPDGFEHQAITRVEIARKLAVVKGFSYAGTFDPDIDYPGPVYHVPGATLVGTEAAVDLGIRNEHDLFGGVVPFGFVATKAITHPLIDRQSEAPSGWSNAFPEAVRPVVLRGFTAFTVRDAFRAGERLLAEGSVRIKPAGAEGAHGQAVVSSAGELKDVVNAMEEQDISEGIVLEQDLADVTTCSIGRLVVGDLTASYAGTQRLTADNSGAMTYGGSTLFVARGGFDELLAFEHSPEIRLAVAQALAYDRAADASFEGLIASRRNYDIAQGRDALGRRRSGVLEQSWRIGGATGAEVAALEAFRDEPELKAVRVSCAEVFGDGPAPPAEAFIYFQGIDRRIGPLIKNAVIEARFHAKKPH